MALFEISSPDNSVKEVFFLIEIGMQPLPVPISKMDKVLISLSDFSF